MDAVRTPLNYGHALALGNKRYRKQVLKLGDIHYHGGIFPVTEDYLDTVMLAFDSKALPTVPFQLADSANTHTKDPLRQFGTVTALHRTPAGLDAVIEMNDEAARLVDEFDLGVSVLIEPDRTTGEGQHYDAVLTHILGTVDPVLTSLGPWSEALAASNAAPGGVLDLLALTAAPSGVSTPTGGPIVADTLTPEETAQLRSLLAKIDAAAPAAEPVKTELPVVVDEVTEELSDEDLQRLADGVLAEGDEPSEQELLAASNESNPEVLALSQRLEASEQANRDRDLQLSQLREERDESHYLAERENFARQFGIHPSVTDIVKPLLKGGSSKLALSNGGEVVPSELIRKFVHEIATRPRLDLSQTKGSALDLDDDEADAKNRDALAAEIAKTLR